MDRNNVSANYHIRVREVALRKESVDRNKRAEPSEQAQSLSLSARRAWIEIVMQEIAQQRKQVALRKESVDRNFVPFDVIRPAIGRSPQGERG